MICFLFPLKEEFNNQLFKNIKDLSLFNSFLFSNTTRNPFYSSSTIHRNDLNNKSLDLLDLLAKTLHSHLSSIPLLKESHCPHQPTFVTH